ncbi:MAG: hypothetical protein AAF675_18610 [Pseudomonadota bacterium]
MKTTQYRAVGLAAALYLGAFGGMAQAVGLQEENVAAKLAKIHFQVEQLNRMVKGVCFVDAGVNVERNRATVYAARDAFEETLPEIRAEVAKLDPKNPAKRPLERSLKKKTDQWFRFRIFLDREMKAGSPDAGALGQIAMMEIGLEKSIERAFKVIRRQAIKENNVSMAELIEESTIFDRVVLAEKMVKEACLVSLKEGGSHERALLGEAIMHFEKVLEVEEKSLLASPPVKALIPEWRSILPRVQVLTTGTDADERLLEDLDALKQEWFDVSGIKALLKSGLQDLPAIA